MARKQILSFFTLASLLWTVVCELRCPRLSPPLYGVLSYNGTLLGENQPEWRENDTVTFQCDRGYVLTAPSGVVLGAEWSVTCRTSDTGSASGIGSAGGNTNSDIAWSGEPQEFTCSRIDCGAPPSITNASFSLGTPNTTDLFSTAHYTCNAGYQSDGVDYSVCWWDGVWRPNITCISTVTIDCGVPPVISNGNRMWTVNRSADVGTTVAYSCAAGYDREGASEIACTASGQWTEPPKCTASAVLSSTEIYIIEGAGAAFIILVLLMVLCFVCGYVCRTRIKQKRYVQDEEALANSGAFTLSNPLVAVKDEDAAGNPLYLTPDELNEFEQQQ